MRLNVGRELVEKAKELLNGRRRAYLLAFGGVAGDTVLRDLVKFCRGHKSTYHPDPYLSARLDGRREVWLRIQEHLELDEEKLWQLYGRDA